MWNEEKRKKVGQRIQRVRKELDLERDDFSSGCGISRNQLEDIENGESIDIPPDFWFWLSNTHYVSLNWIFGGTGDMFLPAAHLDDDFKQMINEFQDNPDFFYRVLYEAYKKTPESERPAWLNENINQIMKNLEYIDKIREVSLS